MRMDVLPSSICWRITVPELCKDQAAPWPAKTAQFNLERGKAKELKGNVTAQSMRKVFGERWKEFSEGKQTRLSRIGATAKG